MPYRRVVFANQCFYHIVNRGVGSKIIFQESIDYQRALDLISYYRFTPETAFTFFNRLTSLEKNKYFKKQTEALVKIYAYCLMPNHFHLLLSQESDKGISKYMGNWQNAYARHFNIKHKKKGYLFESNFKAKLIEEDRIFYHVSRYIHLNPSTAKLTEIDQLKNYQWSSLPIYLENKQNTMVDTGLILGHFQSPKRYQKYVYNNAAYQRSLGKIKALMLD